MAMAAVGARTAARASTTLLLVSALLESLLLVSPPLLLPVFLCLFLFFVSLVSPVRNAVL
jgi:hypothetical protein